MEDKYKKRKSKPRPKGRSVILENYDGKKAYFGNTRYTVLELEGTKYAFPNPSEDEELSSIAKQGKLERKFPIFQIINENSGHEQARAVKVNYKREELTRLLEEETDFE